MMEEMTNANIKEMREGIKSGKVEMKSTVSAIRSKLEDANHMKQDLYKDLNNNI
jgi:hypothetical protein